MVLAPFPGLLTASIWRLAIAIFERRRRKKEKRRKRRKKRRRRRRMRKRRHVRV